MTTVGRMNETDGRGFRVEQSGPISTWGELAYSSPRGVVLQGKGFLGAKLGLTGMEVSVNLLRPGEAYPFSHAHKQNEELYLFLTGTGEMLLDDRVITVGPGTSVRVAPSVYRCWRNTGSDALTYLVIQAREGSLEQATAADGILAREPPLWPE